MICHSSGTTRLIAWLDAGRLTACPSPTAASDRRAAPRLRATQARAHLHAAGLAEDEGDLSAAENHLRLVLLTSEPAFVHLAHLQLARLYLDAGRIEDAAILARAAVDEHPEDPAAQRLLGTAQAASHGQLAIGAGA